MHIPLIPLETGPISTPRNGPAAALFRVHQALLGDDPLDPADRAIAAAAVAQLLAHSTRSASVALRRETVRQRDRLIRALATNFYPAGSLRSRAGQVRQAIDRYRANGWRHQSQHVVCPVAILGTERELLWRLHRLGMKLPTSQRAIEGIIR